MHIDNARARARNEINQCAIGFVFLLATIYKKNKHNTLLSYIPRFDCVIAIVNSTFSSFDVRATIVMCVQMLDSINILYIYTFIYIYSRISRGVYIFVNVEK